MAPIDAIAPVYRRRGSGKKKVIEGDKQKDQGLRKTSVVGMREREEQQEEKEDEK